MYSRGVGTWQVQSFGERGRALIQWILRWLSFLKILLGSKAAKVIRLVDYNKHHTCEKLLVLLNTIKILVLKHRVYRNFLVVSSWNHRYCQAHGETCFSLLGCGRKQLILAPESLASLGCKTLNHKDIISALEHLILMLDGILRCTNLWKGANQSRGVELRKRRTNKNHLKL